MKLVEVVVLHKDGYETYRHDHIYIKDARRWVRECGLSADYWARSSEVDDFAKDNVACIQILVDKEVHSDWYPEW